MAKVDKYTSVSEIVSFDDKGRNVIPAGISKTEKQWGDKFQRYFDRGLIVEAAELEAAPPSGTGITAADLKAAKDDAATWKARAEQFEADTLKQGAVLDKLRDVDADAVEAAEAEVEEEAKAAAAADAETGNAENGED